VGRNSLESVGKYAQNVIERRMNAKSAWFEK
jgi:hypothetical protein